MSNIHQTIQVNIPPKIHIYIPSSYAFSATAAEIFADIFLIFENGGYTRPLLRCSSVTCAARASAVQETQK